MSPQASLHFKMFSREGSSSGHFYHPVSFRPRLTGPPCIPTYEMTNSYCCLMKKSVIGRPLDTSSGFLKENGHFRIESHP